MNEFKTIAGTDNEFAYRIVHNLDGYHVELRAQEEGEEERRVFITRESLAGVIDGIDYLADLSYQVVNVTGDLTWDVKGDYEITLDVGGQTIVRLAMWRFGPGCCFVKFPIRYSSTIVKALLDAQDEINRLLRCGEQLVLPMMA